MLIQKRALINQEKCSRCQSCPAIKECPASALQEEDGFLFVGVECRGCGTCTRACPYQAIELI